MQFDRLLGCPLQDTASWRFVSWTRSTLGIKTFFLVFEQSKNNRPWRYNHHHPPALPEISSQEYFQPDIPSPYGRVAVSSAAESRLRISLASPDNGNPLTFPVPSNTQGPALFRGVIGPSAPPALAAAELCAQLGCAAALTTGGMGTGSDIVCWIRSGTEGEACGGEGVAMSTCIVMSATSPESEPVSRAWVAEGPASGGTTSLLDSLFASELAESSLICCQSSHGSSTSASRSAAARQLGQTKMGY